MKKIGFVLINLLAASTVYAQTSPVSYDYVQAGYTQGDVVGEAFSAIGVNASVSINESVFATASYVDGSTKDKLNLGLGWDEIDTDSFTLGLGFHTPLNNTTDFVFAGSYISTDVDYAGFNDDAEGLGLQAGFRFKPTAKLEFNTFVGYSDVANDNEFNYSASAYYFTTPTLSLGLSYEGADDLDAVAANIRFHF